MNAEKILIIDDESSIRRILRLGLESQGFEIAEAASGPEGLKKAKNLQAADRRPRSWSSRHDGR